MPGGWYHMQTHSYTAAMRITKRGNSRVQPGYTRAYTCGIGGAARPEQVRGCLTPSQSAHHRRIASVPCHCSTPPAVRSKVTVQVRVHHHACRTPTCPSPAAQHLLRAVPRRQLALAAVPQVLGGGGGLLGGGHGEGTAWVWWRSRCRLLQLLLSAWWPGETRARRTAKSQIKGH